MRLSAPGAPHLTYCTNIHPGESWAEVQENLRRHVTAVRDRVAGGGPFGVGLRLSARAAAELGAPGEIEALRDLCARERLYVFTINGFPYGPFHGAPVKERVYLPDWMDEERFAYTERLSEILAALLPDGMEGSISTAPGAFKPRVRSADDAEAMARRLVRQVAGLVALRRRTGRSIALALEPEPCCFLETTAEAVAFFEDHLLSRARIAELAALTGEPPAAAEGALRAHLGVCVDACHLAVEFEEPAAALGALRSAGIRVPKIQISAGLRVLLDGPDPEIAERLRAWAEGVYLHQVVERRPAQDRTGAGDASLTRYLDLPDALAALAARRVDERDERDERGARGDSAEWRIHFHVPIFRELAGPISTTQPDLRALCAEIRRAPAAPHLEVETYTWEVLPEEQRREGVDEAVAREIAWTKEQIEG